MTIIKAVRAIIELGGINLEVFMLPDGKYVLSRTQVFQAVDIVTNDTPRWLKARGLKPLKGKALKFDSNNNGGTFYPVSISNVIDIWYYVGEAGNDKAKLLVTSPTPTEAARCRLPRQSGYCLGGSWL